MIVRYRVSRTQPSAIITRMEFERETRYQYITRMGNALAKGTSHYMYFEKWADAHAHIKGVAERELKRLRGMTEEIYKMTEDQSTTQEAP